MVRPRIRLLGLLLLAMFLCSPTVSAAEGQAGPTATGPLEISPSTVFSAARLSCGGAGWSTSDLSTRWLLDGAPIAGASAATFTAPRADDGHQLACVQTASEAGQTSTLQSPARIVHEQPPQPSWPIAPIARECANPICMQEGSAPQAIGEGYAHEGAWWVARQVRCVSAPWTSIAGDSSLAAVKPLVEAHSVGLSLQRITPAGAVTIVTEQLEDLGAARDQLDGGSPSPFGDSITVPFGGQPFAAGELWTRRYPHATGQPDWLAPGAGLIGYALDGEAARSLQLTYTLSLADRGARLRCVASAKDGPAGAETSASFQSSEYQVSDSLRCVPRRVATLHAPQPAAISIGDPKCLAVPSSLPAIGAGLQGIAVKGGRIALSLTCALPRGCSGRLGLSTANGGSSLARGSLRLRDGASQLVVLELDALARRLLARSAAGSGPMATLRLRSPGSVRTLVSGRLIAR